MCSKLKHILKSSAENDCKGNLHSTLSNYSSYAEVLLQTLLVTIEVFEKRSRVRAVTDSGSQRSYVLNSTVKKLGLKPTRSDILIHTMINQ